MARPSRGLWWPMDDDDRRNPDRQIFRELFDQLDRVVDRVERLSARMEEIAVIGQRAKANAEEIQGLRKKMGRSLERITRLEEKARTPAPNGTAGSALRITPGWFTAILAALTAAGAAAWKVGVYIAELVRGMRTP